jgi:hypothetical protein
MAGRAQDASAGWRRGGSHFHLKLNDFSEFLEPYPQPYPRRRIAKSPLQAQPQLLALTPPAGRSAHGRGRSRPRSDNAADRPGGPPSGESSRRPQAPG